MVKIKIDGAGDKFNLPRSVNKVPGPGKHTTQSTQINSWVLHGSKAGRAVLRAGFFKWKGQRKKSKYVYGSA